jgi:two-component system response regulator AtoC
MLTRVLLAADRPALERRLRRLLAEPDVVVEALGGKKEPGIWERIPRHSADLLIISRSLLAEPPASVMSRLRSVPDSPEVVVLSDLEDPEDRALLIGAGFYGVLFTGLANGVLKQALAALLARRRRAAALVLKAKRPALHPQLRDFAPSSPRMKEFMAIVRRVVASDSSLLITGETGVGKERLARAIHAESPRASGPFVLVNCGALPETLLESELFGHEEGAFTGATRSRRGLFELAHRGTIFLDEIGDMPLHLQVKLLHVLQSREIQRVGAEAPISIDVRVLAATNRDLALEAGAGRFRLDLYYRLGVVTLAIPPLRERREDIPALVESYLRHFRSHFSTEVEGITPAALEALTLYSWPGNVRELVNIVERAMLLSGGKKIDLSDLPEGISSPCRTAKPASGAPAAGDTGRELPREWLERPLRELRREMLASFERDYFAALLRSTGGKVGETARRAGIQPRSLFDKMRRYGLQKEDFRSKN